MRNKWVTGVVIGMLVISCKKASVSPARLMIHNASWSGGDYSATWNGDEILTTALLQGNTSGDADIAYVNLPAGTNRFTISAAGNELLNRNFYVGTTVGYSLFFYDSSSKVASPSLVLFEDDLTPADTAASKLRFFNLVPDTSLRTDIWLRSASDSIRLDSASRFDGPIISTALQTFTPYKVSKPYTISIERSSDKQVLASVNAFPFQEKMIYTIVFSGLPTGSGNSGLKLKVIPHSVR